MSAGISRLHGTAETGASVNLTGAKSMFFSGYQPLMVLVSVAHAKWDLVTGYSAVASNFETAIKTCEVVGSVVGYGIPATESSNDKFIVIFDGATVNQGDGAGGSAGATTGFGALKTALAAASAGGAVAGDFTLTSYTGFSGSGLN